MRKLLLGAVAVAACVSAGTAVADQPKAGGNPCPFVRTIDDFNAVDNYTAIISSSPNRRYLVKFVNSCRELKWAWFARIEARPGICLRPGDVIVAGRNGFVDRCFIQSITQLPPKGTASPASY